jgi:uncharacterized protein (UPF0332 family)
MPCPIPPASITTTACHSRRGHRLVKPQTAAFLAKSREILDKAHDLLGAHHWPDEAGRAAYLAGLRAAQALIFETTGNLRKRHSTVQGEFARLVRDDPRLDMELRAFLPRTYNLKAREPAAECEC